MASNFTLREKIVGGAIAAGLAAFAGLYATLSWYSNKAMEPFREAPVIPHVAKVGDTLSDYAVAEGLDRKVWSLYEARVEELNPGWAKHQGEYGPSRKLVTEEGHITALEKYLLPDIDGNGKVGTAD